LDDDKYCIVQGNQNCRIYSKITDLTDYIFFGNYENLFLNILNLFLILCLVTNKIDFVLKLYFHINFLKALELFNFISAIRL